VPKPKSGLAFPYMKNVSTDLFIRNINLTFCFGFLTEDSKVLSAIFGEAVHFHLLTRRDDYAKSLLELEDKYLEPIQPHDDEFQALDTNWISERGIHFGWDADDENIIFAARIV